MRQFAAFPLSELRADHFPTLFNVEILICAEGGTLAVGSERRYAVDVFYVNKRFGGSGNC